MRFTWVCSALLAAALLAGGGADAYSPAGRAWPGGVIRYYNAAPDQAWAVKQAVAAWNSSGAGVRFVAAPASRADVRIEHFPRISCTINAEATVGYAESARVWIFRRDDRSPYCNPYIAAPLLAHELGHVLGLGHETGGCAVMNPSTTLQGPDLCVKAKPWQWRCRLLTPDDVAGAIALYGGAARARAGTSDCNLYDPMAAPARLTVAPTNAAHQFAVRFTRPGSAAVPAFLTAGHRGEESFVAAASTRGCPHDPHNFQRRLWDASAGRTEETYLRLPTGVSCVSVWAVDSIGRPSAASTVHVRVVEP